MTRELRAMKHSSKSAHEYIGGPASPQQLPHVARKRMIDALDHDSKYELQSRSAQ
jgi:hypothetical protein